MDFTASNLVPLVDEGLGNSAYLVDLGDGGALAVDASRDLRAVRATAEKHGSRVTHAAGTHPHTDFVSRAGSFCSAPPGSRRTSTIAEEKAANPLLGVPDAAAFADALIASLGGYPLYFPRLAEADRRGPALLSEPPPVTAVQPQQVRAATAAGPPARAGHAGVAVLEGGPAEWARASGAHLGQGR